jgi:hypothetical protein
LKRDAEGQRIIMEGHRSRVAKWLESRAGAVEKPGKRPGRPRKYSEEVLARVALTYLEMRDDGDSPSSSPMKDTWEALRDELGLGRGDIEKLIARGKKEGLVPPIGPSRESGRP